LLADHLPSARRAPEVVAPGKVVVVNGRCIVDGSPAAQKCCWVLLWEPMTPDDYRQRFAAHRIPLEPCPGCGGRLEAWGSCPRTLAEGEPPQLNGLRLLRGRCGNPDCPLCTVTHYPCFITPYSTIPTAEREAAVRAHAVQRQSWAEVQRQVRWMLTSVQRWERQVTERAAEVVTGLLAAWQRLDPQAPAEVRVDLPAGLRSPLPVMFQVCDAVRDLLQEREGWTAPVSALAVPRMFRPPNPTTLPVWT
jgi:hypothetical protein